MRSLQKALDIIERIAESKNVGIRKLAAMTGFPPATIHRIITVLSERHYVEQDPATRKYSLSFRILELGAKLQQQSQLVAKARPYLEDLMADTRESANLAVRDGDEMVYVDHVPSDYSLLQLFTRIGARVPLYNTGVGKVFLSTMNPRELEEYLQRTAIKRQTPHTLTTKVDIQKELKRIRERGFAVDNEELEIGVRCIAALVYGHDGQPTGSISVSGAAVRITDERIEELARMVKNAASAVSRDQGFTSRQP